MQPLGFSGFFSSLDVVAGLADGLQVVHVVETELLLVLGCDVIDYLGRA